MTLILKHVRKYYGKVTVIDDVSLSVAPGEIVGLLGPNGAGKTTTFGIATGVVAPDDGRVWLEERDVSAWPLERRASLGLGYLPQQASIFRGLSVSDNLRLVLEQTSLGAADRERHLQKLLQEFGLEEIAKNGGRSISGGQRRRTELARTLAGHPQGLKILLLDEPFANIDPIAVAELQRLIAQLCQRQIGILIIDHNVRETLALVDRAYIMHEGRILAAGTPSDLYTNPLARQHYLGERFAQ
ncbi:MAG: LPS export ABC transporter ATP-binding protein [Cyanobacteria bacterium J06641_5]